MLGSIGMALPATVRARRPTGAAPRPRRAAYVWPCRVLRFCARQVVNRRRASIDDASGPNYVSRSRHASGGLATHGADAVHEHRVEVPRVRTRPRNARHRRWRGTYSPNVVCTSHVGRVPPGPPGLSRHARVVARRDLPRLRRRVPAGRDHRQGLVRHRPHGHSPAHPAAGTARPRQVAQMSPASAGANTRGRRPPVPSPCVAPQVAVKTMKKMYAPLIRREVETWRHLRHPNIIQLYEIIVTESRVHLVRRRRPQAPRLLSRRRSQTNTRPPMVPPEPRTRARRSWSTRAVASSLISCRTRCASATCGRSSGSSCTPSATATPRATCTGTREPDC